MLTTAGIVFLAASLNDAILRLEASAVGSLTVTTSTLGGARHDSKSGRSVATTNRIPRQIVVVWAKISQSLRMEYREAREACVRLLPKQAGRGRARRSAEQGSAKRGAGHGAEGPQSSAHRNLLHRCASSAARHDHRV